MMEWLILAQVGFDVVVVMVLFARNAARDALAQQVAQLRSDVAALATRAQIQDAVSLAVQAALHAERPAAGMTFNGSATVNGPAVGGNVRELKQEAA